MANWCSNKLILRGLPTEIERVRDLLEAKPIHVLQNERVLTAIPRDIESWNRERAGTSFIVFHTLTPQPIDLSPEEVLGWRYAAWGVKSEPQEARRNASTSLTYLFDTPWSMPDRWVRTLAETFPALGIALHGLEPGNGIATSVFYRAGRESRSVNHASSDKYTAREFARQVFGWDLLDDDDDPDRHEEPPSGRSRFQVHASPIRGAAASDLLRLQEAATPQDLQNIEARWYERKIPETVRLSWLAEYAPLLPAPLVHRILRHNGPARRLVLRPSWPTGTSEILFSWAFQQLFSFSPNDIPRSGSLIPVPNSAIPLDMASHLVQMIEEAILKKQQPERLQSIERARGRMEIARIALLRIARQRDVSWDAQDVQALASLLHSDIDIVARIVASFLAALPDTPGAVLEAIAQRIHVAETDLARLLLTHPNAPTGLQHQILEGRVSASAMLELLDDENARRQPRIRQLILAAPRVHPVVLIELARDADANELREIASRLLSRDEDLDYVRYALHAIERAPESSRSRIPPEIWTRLLQLPEFALRERAMLALARRDRPSPRM